MSPFPSAANAPDKARLMPSDGKLISAASETFLPATGAPKPKPFQHFLPSCVCAYHKSSSGE